MPINIWSGSGYGTAYDIKSPKWGFLGNALAAAIVLRNTTAAEINTGTFTVETAFPAHDNMCLPDTTWTQMWTQPGCGCSPADPSAPLEIDLANHPIPPYSECSFMVPCPEAFIRVVGAPAGVDVLLVITRQRESGIPQDPAWFTTTPPISYFAPFANQVAQHPVTTPAPAPAPAQRPRVPAE